ncbi:Transposase DDE domain protein [Corynebacterium atrinae]|uniref:IS1634 family transposase n=1 Tax=Corynebacterium atrinae TaxID=1336740 RepID=UPI0025B2B593|nr:IS1634 family transposase [Corynebacterium atrinae]WJY63745.1 Transposase DDE domain protein [Corynebacterium atrinae]WJY64424.1 Transposase DDE domain protein [Corynebacterium atrinae]WJY64444.1 Transposase DDE domain protein [Corynebacterium atrinae]
MPPKIRTVPTASGATAVQVIWGYRNRKPVLDHLGSAHTDEELSLLLARAQRMIDGDQIGLDLGLNDEVTMPAGTGAVDNPVPITSERANHLINAIHGAYHQLGLHEATDHDPVFYDLVTARIIHPGSKFESIETLAEIGVASASYRTIQRRLPVYATTAFRDQVTKALATHAGIGPGVMVLYDVTTLYFETDKDDDLRKPGFSKERRLEPQITVGLLSDAAGFPVAIGAFEGNKAETQTMLPMIDRLKDAYQLDDITIVADAGMFSAGNKQAVVDAGLHYILGTRERDIPYPIQVWRQANPGASYTDGQVWRFADRTGRGPDGIPHSVTYYQYSWDRARRTLKGIDEQVAKAQRAVAGQVPVKRNRYVDLKAPNKQVNHTLADKHRALAGVKGYETSRVDLNPEQVIGAYRQLFKIEKAFRMAKSDLKARPIFHRKKDSIDAHLTIVMAAMAVGHVLEQRSGLSLKRLVRTLKKYRSFTIEVAGQTVYAQSPVPAEVEEILAKLPRLSD